MQQCQQQWCECAKQQSAAGAAEVVKQLLLCLCFARCCVAYLQGRHLRLMSLTDILDVAPKLYLLG